MIADSVMFQFNDPVNKDLKNEANIDRFQHFVSYNTGKHWRENTTVNGTTAVVKGSFYELFTGAYCQYDSKNLFELFLQQGIDGGWGLLPDTIVIPEDTRFKVEDPVLEHMCKHGLFMDKENQALAQDYLDNGFPVTVNTKVNWLFDELGLDQGTYLYRSMYGSGRDFGEYDLFVVEAKYAPAFRISKDLSHQMCPSLTVENLQPALLNRETGMFDWRLSRLFSDILCAGIGDPIEKLYHHLPVVQGLLRYGRSSILMEKYQQDHVRPDLKKALDSCTKYSKYFG